MNSIKIASFICLVVAVSALAAPTETPAGQTSDTTVAPASEAAATSADQTTSAIGTDGASKDANNTTASLAVSSSHDQPINATAFTCYGREIGYYADIEHECKVYHFCLIGDYNGEQVYQRISYLCLNETVFDQQALDCVEQAKLTSPCAESEKNYDSSNAVLRQAIVGNHMQNGDQEASKKQPTTTTPAPSS